MKTNRNGTRTEKWFDEFGHLHREDGPADTTSGPSGVILAETYYRHGVYHREDGPAAITYSYRGTRTREQWHRDHFVHRFGAPAKIEYRDTGEVRSEAFYLDGNYCASSEVAMLYAAANYDDDRLRKEFAASSDYAPLADDGPDRLRDYLPAIGIGLRTAEGVRAYTDGAPLEWARSFEEATR